MRFRSARGAPRTLVSGVYTVFVLWPASLLIGLFGVRPITALAKPWAYIPGVRAIVSFVWRHTLLRLGYSSSAVDWAEWVCRRWPTPRNKLSLLELYVTVRDFDHAASKLGVERKNILAHRIDSRFLDRIGDVETMLAMEGGEVNPEETSFAVGRGEAVSQYFYQRIWDAHSATDVARVRRHAASYFNAVGFDPEAVIYVCDTLLVPNALWADMLEVLERALTVLERKVQTSSRFQDGPPGRASGGDTRGPGGLRRLLSGLLRDDGDSNIREDLYLRKAGAFLEIGEYEKIRHILDTELTTSIYAVIIEGRLALSQNRVADGRALLTQALTDRRLPAGQRAEVAGLLAENYEEERKYSTARQYYVSCLKIGGLPYYLPPQVWRLISLCAAENQYEEAALIMDMALPQSWKHFTPLARKPIHKRLRKREMVSPHGAFIVGCWGVGDDVIRMAMFDALYGDRPGVKYGLSCDPRMTGLYARSFENFEVVPISRMNGPFAVSEAEYYRLRDGVPPSVDRGRLDFQVYKAAKRYPDVSLTEDFMNAFFRVGSDIRRRNEPMFKVLPEKREEAKRWLSTLPPGIKVGITWRSGTRNIERDKSYTDIVKDWGDILRLKGLTFINLQYSWESEELEEAQSRYGCVIHTPEFDLKHDLEDLLAMSVELDVVIAPCTATRDLCAAAGAELWALTTTPFLPDLWRLDADGVSDRLFPNMTHVTSNEFGGKQGVLKEMARRLQAMVEAATVQPPRRRRRAAG